MTTIAANLDTMAADSRVTWEGIGQDTFTAIKIFSTNKAIYGITGENCTGSLIAIDWFLSGSIASNKPIPPEYENNWDWKIIELSKEGIAIYNEFLEKERTAEPFLAVGSGRKVAMYCMKYLGMQPPEAVHEACKVDHWSEVPIYTASLKRRTVIPWPNKP